VILEVFAPTVIKTNSLKIYCSKLCTLKDKHFTANSSLHALLNASLIRSALSHSLILISEIAFIHEKLRVVPMNIL